MKFYQLKLFSVVAICLAIWSCDSPKEGDSKKSSLDTFKEVPNDPMGVRIYTLSNGLKVYLSVNKEEPRIKTEIAVRAGSKQDPDDATGLAHYLEHMLFKGSDEIATANWDEERKLLQEVSDLYEVRRSVTDTVERKNIYHKIDSISQLAVKHAVPNEYDKMISSIGAKGTNAYTWLEQTVYVNDIPSNELEKWLMVESERFETLVLRLFHTELETVYEEFNRSQDSDFRKAFAELMDGLFENHNYKRSTLGLGEHLKNPSLVKIHEYFNTYYKPNNMAIIMAGDLDPEKTVALIEKYFGHYKPAEIPEYSFTPEKAISKPIEREVMGSQTASLMMGYRMSGIASKDPLYLRIVDGIMNNGQAGLVDLNLIQKQKVLSAGSGLIDLKDYSIFYMHGVPREGQSLKEVEKHLVDQLELVKKGEFDDWLIEAIIKNMKLDIETGLESNNYRTGVMTDAFIKGEDWKDVVSTVSQLEAIKKEDIVKFAKEKFKNNYVVVYKKQGVDNSLHKVQKPEISKLDIERGEQSAFYKKFEAVKSDRVKPVFVDYNEAIKESSFNKDIPFSYVKNNTNSRFSLYYVFDLGSDHDKKLALAVNYLKYLGTTKQTAEEVQKEFYKLGLNFDVHSGRDRIYVSLKGLEESLEKGLALFEEFLADVKPDQEALTNLVADVLKGRNDVKLDKGAILRKGLFSYGMYGTKSPLRDIIPAQKLKSIKASELTDKIKELSNYKHRIFYYGSKNEEEVLALLNKSHKVPQTLKPYPQPVKFVELPTDKNKVYFVDYEMVQAEILMLSRGSLFDKTILSKANVYNQYFGAGLSSIVFQEIREAKALAYSAYSFFANPDQKDEHHYVQAYLGVQSDKLKDAVTAIVELMNDMPEAETQFEASKIAALKKIETQRITKEQLFWSYEGVKKLGLDYDVRKDVYNEITDITMAGLKTFFDENVKGRNYNYLIIGKKENIDLAVLKSLGEFKQLSLEEIFGY